MTEPGARRAIRWRLRLMLTLFITMGWTLPVEADTRAADQTQQEDVLRLIAAQLQTGVDVQRGQFAQQKFLPELATPLLSSGDFIAAREHGLLWSVTAPFASQMIMTPSRLSQRVGSTETLRLRADDQPGLSALSAILLAIFLTDIDALKTLFSVDRAEMEGAEWTLTLRPNTAGVRAAIDTVTVEGQIHVTRISLLEAGGDRSLISLKHNTSGEAPALSAEEKALFSE